MRFFTARRLALAAAFPVLLSLTLIPGCAKQGEGERCGYGTDPSDAKGIDSDCDDGLVCTSLNAGVYRCCNPARLTARCVPLAVISSSGGAAGAAGTAGAGRAGAGTAGGSTAGGGTAGGGTAGAAASGASGAGTAESAAAGGEAGAEGG